MTEQKEGEVLEQDVPVVTKAQEAARANMEKAMRKRAEMDLADYKKRLRSSNELKRLQVEELELSIAYYHNKKEWLELKEPMKELEKMEMEIIKKERKEAEDEHKKRMEELEQKKKSNIVVPKMGKPRE